MRSHLEKRHVDGDNTNEPSKRDPGPWPMRLNSVPEDPLRYDRDKHNQNSEFVSARASAEAPQWSPP